MIDETVQEIEEMRTHSSSIVAIKAAEALLELCEREHAAVEEFERAVEHNSNALRRANPSHASLFTAQRSIVDALREADPETVSEAKSHLREVVARVVAEIEEGKERAAENAEPLFEDGATILTHDFSSTVLSAVEAAVLEGRSMDVFVTEARPRYLGRRMARTLATFDGIDAHLVVDSAAGYYLPRCDRVVVGMDCIVDDVLYNRVGTFPMAVTAAYLDVPMTVVGSGTKVIEEGFVFENDFRSAVEVMSEPAEGFSVENPAYDATPVSLLDSVVTDTGTHTFD